VSLVEQEPFTKIQYKKYTYVPFALCMVRR